MRPEACSSAKTETGSNSSDTTLGIAATSIKSDSVSNIDFETVTARGGLVQDSGLYGIDSGYEVLLSRVSNSDGTLFRFDYDAGSGQAAANAGLDALYAGGYPFQINLSDAFVGGEDGLHLSFGYDEFGRVVSSSRGTKPATTYLVGNGLFSEIRNPASDLTSNYFDARGRLIRSVDAAGRAVVSEYDDLNRRIEQRLVIVGEPDGVYHSRITYKYDDFGNVVEEVVYPRTDGTGTPFSAVPLRTIRWYSNALWPKQATASLSPDGLATWNIYDDATGVLLKTIGPVKVSGSLPQEWQPANYPAVPSCAAADLTPCTARKYEWRGVDSVLVLSEVATKVSESAGAGEVKWSQSQISYDDVDHIQINSATSLPNATQVPSYAANSYQVPAQP